MREQFGSALVIGLVVVAIAVGAIFYMQRGAHMELTGPVVVHTISTDPNTSLALIDLHLTNPSDYPFEVSNVSVVLENNRGEFPTDIVGRVDTERMFQTMPENGPFHPTLYYKATIPAHSTSDYTVAAQYNAPESMLKERKQFVVKIREVSGQESVLPEK